MSIIRFNGDIYPGESEVVLGKLLNGMETLIERGTLI